MCWNYNVIIAILTIDTAIGNFGWTNKIKIRNKKLFDINKVGNDGLQRWNIYIKNKFIQIKNK